MGEAVIPGREIFEVDAPYKITFPIEKAETRDDGLYLVGLATGPEIDSENQRIHPSLIQKWADQINSGDPDRQVIYRDWHQKNSSAADLGVLTKAWVTDEKRLGVEVRLDEDNPTALYIHKSIDKKKKQFGMSVAGKVHSYADEFVAELGRKVRTFYDATLEEVSNTTKPIWTPSLGTVLSKAVDEAAAEVGAADGGTRVGDEIKTETVAQATEVETATETGAATEATSTEVEKAIKTETKRDDKQLADIVKVYGALGQKLRDAGLLTEEAASTESTAETVTKSESTTETAGTTSAPEVVTLAKAVSDLTQIVTDLAARTPDGSAPATLVKAEAVDPLAELYSVTDPIERLRLAMAAKHGETLR